MFNQKFQRAIGVGAAVAALAIAAPLAAADPAPAVIPHTGQQPATEYWKSFLRVHADLPDGRAGLHRTPPGGEAR